MLIDKPAGPSSRAVLDDVARRLGLRSCGHCGTLDPLASGLLVLVFGAATRLQDLLMGGGKTYLATLVLGATSHTDDAEGPITYAPGCERPGLERLEQAVAQFLGEIEQRPPRHSAIHVGGERAYRLARRGETPEMPARTVTIDAMTIRRYRWPELLIEVRCGPGTYIRSLARDVGEVLGTGAYLAELRRLESGAHSVTDASNPAEASLDSMLTLEQAFASFPRATVASEHLDAFLSGREVPVETDAEVGSERLAWSERKLIARAVVLRPGRLRMRRLVHDPRAPAS